MNTAYDDTPEVKTQVALTAAQDGTELLDYPNLDTEIKKQESYMGKRWEGLNDSEPDSVIELSSGIKLANVYLLKTALDGLRAQTPESKKLWENRFTQANIELFGEPDDGLIVGLAKEKLTELSRLRGREGVDQSRLDRVVSTYSRLLPDESTSEASPVPEIESQNLQEIADYIDEKYGEVLSVTGGLPEDTQLGPEQMVELFNRQIKILAKTDDNWARWLAELKDQAGLSISNDDYRVRVGNRRASVAPSEFQQLSVHELLIHALRNTNGLGQSSSELHEPLQGYSKFEEGMGILFEYVVSGKFPEKAKYRYQDIAFVLGMNDVRLNRHQLQEFVLDRDIIDHQSAGMPYDEAKLAKQAWSYVDRILRGSNGDDNSLAISTKDIFYFQGYIDVVNYININIAEGKTIPEILDYLLQAKFDPNEESHKKHIKKYGSIPVL